jgi:O-antigen ligase
VQSARPILRFALLSLVALAWMFAYGLARGGSPRFAVWQVYKFLYLPFVYLVMCEAIRGSVDAPAVGRVVLGVGAFRALEAIILRFLHPSTTEMPHATTHHDSVLFVTCLSVLAAMLVEAPRKRSLVLTSVLGPLYLWAMLANHRRLAWAELGIVLVFLFAVTPWGRIKRGVAKWVLVTAPLLAVYLAVGWDRRTTGFGPVQTLRSLLDPDVDASNAWRELENRNLIFTFSQRPLFGSGFGHEFTDNWSMPDVVSIYPLEMYVPHNSVLGLWAFGGLIGFAALWALFPVGLFFAVRAYRCARTPVERIAALTAAAAQICYLVQGYGDLGFGTWGPVFLVAASYALTGKICVANGGWPAPRRSA